MYILDTNVLRAIFTDKGQQPLLETRIKQTPYEHLYISIVSAHEILRGTLELFRNHEKAKLVEAYGFVEKLLLDLAKFQILSFDEADNAEYVAMSAEIRRTGKGDCRIAASAIVRGLIVITRNERDFKAIGASCENWFVV